MTFGSKISPRFPRPSLPPPVSTFLKALSKISRRNSTSMKFSWDMAESRSPQLVLAAEDETFDNVTIQHWKEEGFQVTYLACSMGKQKVFESRLQDLSDQLEMAERYAIVAFGEAARIALEVCSKPMPKLCTLVVYYPDKIPSPAGGFPPSINVLAHIAGSQGMAPKFPSYSYPNVEVGFAETDLEPYDRIAATLAWTRTLTAVRKGLGIEVDLEKVWEKHLELKFAAKDAASTMDTMVAEPYVNHIPTLTGGTGYEDLYRFYKDYFIPGNPPSTRMQLVSRTIGTDRVVDEIFFSFSHTQEIPWMLPGIEPTDREVEVALVVVCCIRGGKLYREHVYWDQATVLMQIGLLDPRLVPGGKASAQLPVVNGAGARKLLDESSSKSNELIESW